MFTTEQPRLSPPSYHADVAEDPIRRTAAETTVAIVLSAAQTGASLCIPGAREVRVAHAESVTPTADAAAPLVAAVARPAPDDAEQREYARAGGGAPSERAVNRRVGVIERFCRLLR